MGWNLLKYVSAAFLTYFSVTRKTRSLTRKNCDLQVGSVTVEPVPVVPVWVESTRSGIGKLPRRVVLNKDIPQAAAAVEHYDDGRTKT